MHRRVIAATVLATLLCATTARAQVDEVRFPFPQDDGTLTPYTFELGYPLVTLVYDTIAWRDADGDAQPWLARSIRRDGTTVTVRLRDGARWHDGRPLTARDVAFTYRYVATHPHPRFTPQLRDVASVSATNDRTVVIRLRWPSLGLEDGALADIPILPAHVWSGRDSPPRGLPVGSGPYRLVEHDAGGYRFAAQEDYFLGRPTADRVEVPIVPRADRAVADLRAGRLDAVPVAVGDSGRSTAGVVVTTGPGYLGTVLMLNLARPPFDRPIVRQAVAQALDLDRIARAVAGGLTARGMAAADRGYLSPASPWATPAPLHRFEPDAARIAFAEQGVPPITILAPEGNPVAREAGRQVVLALARVGARARLEPRSGSALAAAVGQDGAAPTFQAAVWSTPPIASYDPAFLRVLFGSGEALNYPGYRSRAFDRLADRADEAPTSEERTAAVGAQLETLARDLPVVPLLYADATFAYRPSAYDGWQFVAGSGIIDKRSFLPHGEAPPARSVRDPVDSAAAAEASLLPWPLGLAAVFTAGVAVAVFRRRA